MKIKVFEIEQNGKKFYTGYLSAREISDEKKIKADTWKHNKGGYQRKPSESRAIEFAKFIETGDRYQITHFDDKWGRAFGYISERPEYEDEFSDEWGEEGKMIIGPGYHCSINGGKPGHRDNFDYPGRLWLDKKLISFYIYPPKEMMPQVLDDIKKAHDEFRENTSYKDKEIDWSDGWRIEVYNPVNDSGEYWDDWCRSECKRDC